MTLPNSRLLDAVHEPSDLRKLPEKDLRAVADELRTERIDRFAGKVDGDDQDVVGAHGGERAAGSGDWFGSSVGHARSITMA